MSKELDLHNLTVVEAIKLIQRTIVENPTCSTIIAIHGFNHGCAIKELLKNKFNIHNKQVRETIPDFYNEGRTYILLNRGR